MRASVYFREPPMLREMCAGDLFIVHFELMHECICARVLAPEPENFEVGDPDDDELDIVVIACRVGDGEVGHVSTGCVVGFHPTTWVTPVVPLERVAFRERMPLNEVPAVATQQPLDPAHPHMKGRIERAHRTFVSPGPEAQPEPISRL